MPDIPPLSPLARAALAQERALPSVAASRRDRAVARARAAARAGEAPAALHLSTGVSRMRWVAAAALVCTAAAAGATILEWRGHGHPTATPPAASAPSEAGNPRAAVPSAKVTDGDQAPLVRRAPPEATAIRGAEQAAPSNRSAPRAALSDELRVLAPARQAVARRDFGAALAAISEHARRFREGRLAEEREALRVKALAGLGNVKEARAASVEFRRRFPRSALLPAVGGALDGE